MEKKEISLEPLDNTVRYINSERTTPDGRYIIGHVVVGNTGFGITTFTEDDGPKRGQIQYRHHFTPEGHEEEVSDLNLRKKYALIYPFALLSLLTVLDNPEEARKIFKFEIPKKLTGTTNKRMGNYLTKLLGKDSFDINEATEGSETFNGQLNLEKINSSPVIKARLKSLSQKCERMNFTMHTMQA